MEWDGYYASNVTEQICIQCRNSDNGVRLDPYNSPPPKNLCKVRIPNVSYFAPLAVATSTTYGVFSNCTSLREVEIGKNATVTDIPDYTFSNTAITSIDLPATVISISDTAFNNVKTLKRMICRATTPPSLGAMINTIRAIYVPDEAVESYKAATNWASMADYIFGISELPQELQ